MQREPYIPAWQDTLTIERVTLCRRAEAGDLGCPLCEAPLNAALIPQPVFDEFLQRLILRAGVLLVCDECGFEEI